MIPKHIAIIMDGNGRWAQNRHLPRFVGHREGAKRIKAIIEHAGNIGIKYLSVYAFSTENWKRPQKEVDTLMDIFQKYLKAEAENMLRDNIRLIVTGRKEGVSSKLLNAISEVEELTAGNDGLTFNICFNYGGRSEIIDAVKKIIESGEKNISEENFKDYLYSDIPDPELVIRTSGEFRISNFLLWQIAYSEIYVTDVLWPDFDEKEFDRAIETFRNRDRRFGGVKNVK
ncbi:MAG: isoprenyl transferase [Fusobacteriia bacterium 4572_74]|nr:MAG: isoprenyl transferase [Fusobacteriia bacterium 4572_74]